MQIRVKKLEEKVRLRQDALKLRIKKLEEEERLRQEALKKKLEDEERLRLCFSGPIIKKHKSAASSCSNKTIQILCRLSGERKRKELHYGKFISSDLRVHVC